MLHIRKKGHKVPFWTTSSAGAARKNIIALEHHGISFFHSDVCNPGNIANLPFGIELICDTSARPSVVTGCANPVFDISNNGLGAFLILECVRMRSLPLIF